MKTYRLKEGDIVLIELSNDEILAFTYEQLVRSKKDNLPKADTNDARGEGKKSKKTKDSAGTSKKKIALQVNAHITGPGKADRSEGKDPSTPLETCLQNIFDYHNENSKSDDLSYFTIQEAKKIILEMLETGIIKRKAKDNQTLTAAQEKRRTDAIATIKADKRFLD